MVVTRWTRPAALSSPVAVKLVSSLMRLQFQVPQLNSSRVPSQVSTLFSGVPVCPCH